MANGPVKSGVDRVRQAAVTVLIVAAGVRIAWALVAPAVPILVSLIVVLAVLSFALFGRRSKLATSDHDHCHLRTRSHDSWLLSHAVGLYVRHQAAAH